MTSLNSISLGILLGSLLVLAGILSSLIALRFGAPLLLVFLLVGMLAGEAGPFGLKFDDVGVAYTVGSVALGLILFDGGLRTRFQTFRNVIGAGRHAGDRRRHRDCRAHRAGRYADARPELDRGAADGCCGRLDRCRRSFLPAPCQGIAAAATRQRHAGGRIRPQRSARDLPHHRAGGIFAGRRASLGPSSLSFSRARRSWAASSVISAGARSCSCSTGSICRRACTHRSWQPARLSSSALPRLRTARASSPSTSPAWWWETAPCAPTTRSWCFSTP